ncbi:GCN5 family acetyltransferase [Erwinia typographi]|uniref:GCN5 family acetyltransferase n=2 Tax=Erwinia typographi TaxID=371042 RepID=A0A0A3ZEL2_9GAMM|nr:GCN5 family acetyltransferase [Erwinia typographi]
MTFSITEVGTDSAELMTLVSELDTFQSGLYPAESNHCLDLSAVKDEQICCVIMRDSKGMAIGCGAVVLQGAGIGEIKRVYIRPGYRGRKLGEKIIAYLEEYAVDSACHLLCLETGIHQEPAISLYLKCGYKTCEAFPPYAKDPLSVFMRKSLNAIS